MNRKQINKAIASAAPLLEADLIFETEKHYVIKRHKGFEIYRNGACAANRVGVVEIEGEAGLGKCIDYIKRWESKA